MTTKLDPTLSYLDPGSLLELASAIDATYQRTIKAIARLQADVAAQKSAIAKKWTGTPIGITDRNRIEGEEVRMALLAIRKSSEKELDALFASAGDSHAIATSQRPFYASPVMMLNRLTLGDARRSTYLEQTASIGPVETAHLGQLAVSTKNVPLAAALVTRLDSMALGSRPFSGVALAEAMCLDEYRKAVESIKIVEARFQGIVVAIRAWKADRTNTFDLVSLALQKRTLDESVLRELEGDGG